MAHDFICILLLFQGDYEPTEEECDWPSDEEDEELAGDMKDKAKLEDEKAKPDEEKDVKGIPEFWLTIFKNVDMLQEMVQEADEPLLKKLTDITVTFSESPMVSKAAFSCQSCTVGHIGNFCRIKKSRIYTNLGP